MTAGRTLPWLQDTAQETVSARWNVTFRDFRILDSQNRVQAVFNLTDHDLSVPTNRVTLKQMLLDAARIVDSNGDGLSDDWALQYFGNASVGAEDDTNGNGLDNFTKYAFGLDPLDWSSRVPIRASLLGDGAHRTLAITFRRRAGSDLDYVIESSLHLKDWSTNGVSIVQPSRNLFDGTGTSEVGYTLTWPTSSQSAGFLRVRAVLHPH
jgi:hypothetical protein